MKIKDTLELKFLLFLNASPVEGKCIKNVYTKDPIILRFTYNRKENKYFFESNSFLMYFCSWSGEIKFLLTYSDTPNIYVGNLGRHYDNSYEYSKYIEKIVENFYKNNKFVNNNSNNNVKLGGKKNSGPKVFYMR